MTAQSVCVSNLAVGKNDVPPLPILLPLPPCGDADTKLADSELAGAATATAGILLDKSDADIAIRSRERGGF